jgi:Gamma-glutamyl cyclotransferase, AIG2-like
MTPIHLYTYGTLQLPQIMSRIVGREVLGRPARLVGYARYRIVDRVYPAIVEAPGAELSGVVYERLDPAELERLDHYEGPTYERRVVHVDVGSAALEACTYVLRAEHVHRLSAEPWDLERFEREHLVSYLARISFTLRAP